MPQMVKIGQLVSSRTGRDAGKHYVVVGFGSAPFILLADGRTRRVDDPKKKNVRHVMAHQAIAGAVAEKVRQGQRITDGDIRQALNEWLEQHRIKE